LKRITKAALGGLAGCALVLGGTQVASGSDVIKQLIEGLSVGDLLDPEVDPADVDPADIAFDTATATVRIMDTPDGTGFKLRVEGIATSVAGQTFGAHLHIGPCSALPLSDTTGVHYRDVEAAGATPENEVWFALVPSANGVATDDTFVSFKPVGAESIVIHHHANDAQGKAGPKEVCVPLDGVF
jgi:hypothetical protein